MKFLDKIAYRNAEKIGVQQCLICAYKDTEEFEALCESFGGSLNPVVCVFKQDDAFDVFYGYLDAFVDRELRGEDYPYWPFGNKIKYICSQILSIWVYSRFLKKMGKKEAVEWVENYQKG